MSPLTTVQPVINSINIVKLVNLYLVACFQIICLSAKNHTKAMNWTRLTRICNFLLDKLETKTAEQQLEVKMMMQFS